MDAVSAVIIGAHTVIFAFGGAITVFAYRAFARTGSKQLKALAVGFGIMTAGTLLGIGSFQIGVLALQYAVAVQSLAIAVGFVTLAYSLQTSPSSATPTGYTAK